jgi:hypothetical protein
MNMMEASIGIEQGLLKLVRIFNADRKPLLIHIQRITTRHDEEVNRTNPFMTDFADTRRNI